MRVFLPVAAFALFTAPAFAQTTPPATPVPPAPPAHHRLTFAEHFAKANTTHDGHLTLAQAKTGFQAVARHFSEIDVGNKGYVTQDDIHAWAKAERERRHAAQQAASAPTKG